MEVYIHYAALPTGMTLLDAVGGLNEVLDEHGAVSGGERGRLDLTLEDETMNPKFAQLAVKSWLRRTGFPSDTRLEIGGMEIGIYEE